MSEPPYRIDVEEEEIVVRFTRGALGRDQISRFLDYLVLDAIRRRSELTEEDAAALADEVDRAVWDRARSRGLS